MFMEDHDMQLQPGVKAPLFTLPDAEMQMVDLASYQGSKYVVLFFYPKDGTPCCIKELTDFSDHEEDFVRAGCVLFGISRDDCLRHAELCDREGIGTELLSDSDGVVCKQYGVWQAREVDGHRKYGVSRSTFIIDRDGVIRHALYNVNYKGHALDVLHLVKELNS
jgi:thioredoxin-dependent peroxiredoxin